VAQLLECGDCCALLTAERMAVHERAVHDRAQANPANPTLAGSTPTPG
jgi:hypothetical protein